MADFWATEFRGDELSAIKRLASKIGNTCHKAVMHAVDRIGPLEVVAQLAKLVQDEEDNPAEKDAWLSANGWQEKTVGKTTGWVHPDYPISHQVDCLSAQTACMVELDHALSQINGG